MRAEEELAFPLHLFALASSVGAEEREGASAKRDRVPEQSVEASHRFRFDHLRCFARAWRNVVLPRGPVASNGG